MGAPQGCGADGSSVSVCVVCSFSGSPRLPAVMTQQPGEFVVPYPAWLQTREVKVYFFRGLTSSFFVISVVAFDLILSDLTRPPPPFPV